MDLQNSPEDVVLRRMIKEAEKVYEKIDKPAFHRVAMGNDPKNVGLDCTEFQRTDLKDKVGNRCFYQYFSDRNNEAKREFPNYPHCIKRYN